MVALIHLQSLFVIQIMGNSFSIQTLQEYTLSETYWLDPFNRHKVMSPVNTAGPQGSVFTLFYVILALNNYIWDFKHVFFDMFLALVQEPTDETYVKSMAEYVRLIQSKYMFVRVERPRGSKQFVFGYVKCDRVFSFEPRFKKMRLRLNCIPPVVLTEVEVEENKELRLACIGKTDYERALAKHGNTFIPDDIGTCTNKFRLTPLGAAIHFMDYKSAEALLNGGDDPNDVDRRGWNALHRAAPYGCPPPLLRRILDMIQNVNAVTTRGGFTALMLAVGGTHLDMVIMLMNHHGIDVNIPDHEKNTALHGAVLYNRPVIVTQLVRDDRVNTSLRNENNMTPLSFAINYGGGREECVEIMKEHGVVE